ncbi:putative mitochondrial cysteine synthase [Trichomonascus vanleenenianus]|uniref:putative cysteine synthase n=1 Tax=Trichomonascus vanleenenianus TaxID=2268995 RepID=UPI003ECB0792
MGGQWRSLALCACVSIAGTYLVTKSLESKQKTSEIKNGVAELIGETPVIRLASLSDATGCEILGKMEMQNPGGSAKDRVALAIIEEAERKGLLRPNSGDMVFEGTSGSTGISIAILCKAKGYEAHIVLPDDTSQEKVELLTNLGAVVHKVRPAGIADSKHYVNYARTAAEAINKDDNDPRRAVFADQFENEANWTAHYEHTGPEIYRQAGGKIDAFVAGAGTGGTISGVAHYLKERLPNLKVVLADPPGSGLYNRVKFGVMFDTREREGTRRRHQVDTLVEGIGINRVTRNFEAGRALVDDAIRVDDAEAVKMAKYIVEHEGLFIGSSSGVNLVAAYKYAKQLGPGHTIVTIICDSGSRHLSKFWRLARDVKPDLDF